MKQKIAQIDPGQQIEQTVCEAKGINQDKDESRFKDGVFRKAC